MIRVIVNDASCLIDLRKGGLLGVVCDLPYRFVIPLPVRVSEVLGLSEAEWQALDKAGMITHDLTAEEVGQALEVKERHPGLSANDCFCLVTARVYPGILLTGDALLRKVAEGRGMRVHGVLWVVDELEAAAVCSRSLLSRALKIWHSDEAVFLPPQEISARLEFLAKSGPKRRRRLKTVRCSGT
ncbi:MAG: type II toxin-antitoxin system VapC family toxin [Paracoccaceae bacterium]|nr:type II toxin-antitoxin system VapC family toxin [Paracoccaceae bacterium]